MKKFESFAEFWMHIINNWEKLGDELSLTYLHKSPATIRLIEEDIRKIAMAAYTNACVHCNPREYVYSESKWKGDCNMCKYDSDICSYMCRTCSVIDHSNFEPK